uniref:Uncharacterized protein n=1 Tax=Anopheles atroparvus TaxID=41427 RepID=A0AAG5D4E6_ANOAO
MANNVRLTLVFVTIFGVLSKSAQATDCPVCVGVQACDTNQTIPSVPCTATIVNQTVLQLNQFFTNLSTYTAPATEYSCVSVEFSLTVNSSNIFAVRGCTSGTKNICSEPHREINGALRCIYNSGQSLHDRGHSVLTGLLLNMAVLIGAFALSS